MGRMYKYIGADGYRWTEYWFTPEIWDIIKEYLLPKGRKIIINTIGMMLETELVAIPTLVPLQYQHDYFDMGLLMLDFPYLRAFDYNREKLFGKIIKYNHNKMYIIIQQSKLISKKILINEKTNTYQRVDEDLGIICLPYTNFNKRLILGEHTDVNITHKSYK